MIGKHWYTIPYVLKHRGRGHYNYYCMAHWYWRWFYTFKTIVCILIGRYRGVEYGTDITEMAMWDFQKGMSWDYGECTDWMGIAVGSTVFHNWYYGIYRDGYP
jgi:hypothetical protein